VSTVVCDNGLNVCVNIANLWPFNTGNYSVKREIFSFCWFCLFVCLSVNKNTQKVVDELSAKFLEGIFLRTTNSQLDFESDLLSDVDPGILFLLRLFAVYVIVLLYCCSLSISSIMPVILVMSLISMLCTSLTLKTKTYSLVEF